MGRPLLRHAGVAPAVRSLHQLVDESRDLLSLLLAETTVLVLDHHTHHDTDQVRFPDASEGVQT